LGYGYQHFQASFGEWGLSMQDDVADAVLWAVKQGWVDAKRVCIAGASYGGYAVMMGLVRDPQIWKCGINWVGVTDLSLLTNATWSDTNQYWDDAGVGATSWPARTARASRPSCAWRAAPACKAWLTAPACSLSRRPRPLPGGAGCDRRRGR